MKMTTRRTMNRFAAITTVFLALLSGAACQEIRTVSVTVVEEDGTPVVGAKVTIEFLGHSGEDDREVVAETDSKGHHSARGSSIHGPQVFVEKEGYYKSYIGRLSRKEDHNLRVVLRRKINPIPLYAKKFGGKVPSLGAQHGFDFSAGDWVQPHGTGTNPDILIKVVMLHANENQGKIGGKLEVTFPNEDEGIAAVNMRNGFLPHSALKVPNQAFVLGYEMKYSRIENGYQNEGKEVHTAFYIRCRKQEGTGEPKFNYAKLRTGFYFNMGGGAFLEEIYRKKSPGEYGYVEFTYCFNPNANDRNLEFDPSQNLFKDLEPEEMVREP